MSFEDELIAEPWRFDLFSVLRRFEREHPQKPRIGDAATLAEEYLVVSQNPYMEFPASTLEGAGLDGAGRMRLIARFLGMFGPQGALPLTTTEESYLWLLERDDAFPRFVDIFQRRFLSLFFRAWADPRPIAQNDRPDADRFRTYIGSMIGVGTPPYRDADTISDFAKMEFAGLLAPKAKSASRLRNLIAGLFGVRVEIDEFVGSWLSFDKQECTRLGACQQLARRAIASWAQHVQRQRQVSHSRVREELCAIYDLPARRRTVAADRRRCVSATWRRIRLGRGAGYSGWRGYAGSPRRWRHARLDELDGSELVEDGRDDPDGRQISCGQPSDP